MRSANGSSLASFRATGHTIIRPIAAVDCGRFTMILVPVLVRIVVLIGSVAGDAGDG